MFVLCVITMTHHASAQSVLVVKARTVHTMSGAPIADGVVVVRDGKIAAVGKAADVAIPNGAKTIEAAVVTPGLIDAHCTVGFSGIFNHPHDQDQLERSAPIQPELRAIDAFNPRERLVEWVRGFGVTTIHTGHAPGEVISGQTLIAKTSGETVEKSVIVMGSMEAALTPLMLTIEAGHSGVKVFSLPSVDHPEYGRHIELGVKGAPDAVNAAYPALLEGLHFLNAKLGPELVR